MSNHNTRRVETGAGVFFLANFGIGDADPAPIEYLDGSTRLIYRQVAVNQDATGYGIWQIAKGSFPDGTQFYAYATEESLLLAFPGIAKSGDKCLRQNSKKEIMLRLDLACEYKWFVKKVKEVK